eukprot:CAMPEP_0116871958 /NCGR_PEP_ID=MMETSP0463-20121206/2531_1 /TAXON_ID=181622 /ORGANISM="Strombidinopsis sp, Strain SopsisLIS2011" /LENGTH=50 /DNA_ID=CAMNT_0004511345 /DNA_START=523 /DNA_END=672 /DNA_ORIENTATION=+
MNNGNMMNISLNSNGKASRVQHIGINKTMKVQGSSNVPQNQATVANGAQK